MAPLRSALLTLACAAAPVATGTASEGGLYRLTAQSVPDGVEVRLTDRSGRPIEDAAVHVELAGGLDDPGECDDIGPDRCFHPDGRYLTRGPVPAGAVTVRIDGPGGADRAVLTPDR